MQDPIVSKIENTPRPTIFAASALLLLAAVGLWLSSLAELIPGVGGAPAVSNGLYYLPFMALPLALFMRAHPGLSASMRLNPLPLLPTLSVALLALLSVYVASVLAALWAYPLRALGLSGLPDVPTPENSRELTVSILVLAALPAVCEELLFRGFTLAAWESRGTAFAVAVTGALFALIHGNLFGLPVYLLVGMVSGFVTCALDSVYAGIVYHTVYNAACLVLPFLLAQRGASAGELTVDSALVFSIALETAMLLGMMAVLLTSLLLWARRHDVAVIPRIRRPLSPRDKAMLTVLAAELALSLAAVTILGGMA